MKTTPRICVIGAGPSGMSVLYQFAEMGNMPNVVCYEKQKTWGGIWNFTWRTGLDENNEHCHSSLYKDLWTNAPKEANLEFPDYTFEKHFGKAVPSFMPASAVKDYLEGRWKNGTKIDLSKYIQFNTVVRYVRYDVDKEHYVVVVDNCKENETREEFFSHVIVCAGIFNFPNQPELPGIDKFQGRVLHSHNFRGATEFKGQTVLIIGGSFSAEDIALQSIKFGAKHVILTCRHESHHLRWPEGVEERPFVDKFDGNKVCFLDGSEMLVDVVVFCTGYRTHFPFLESKLRLSEDTAPYPSGLYKGTLLVEHGDCKLFYIGVQNQIYSMTLFDCLASWVCKYILGKLPDEPKSMDEMLKDVRKWEADGQKVTNPIEMLKLHTTLLDDISTSSGYTKDILKAGPRFMEWLQHRTDDMATFRDHSFRSIYTNTLAPTGSPFMQAFDDSLETFKKC
ncbi:hypothetical protein ACF0H5_019618 [Mactra antiquata]